MSRTYVGLRKKVQKTKTEQQRTKGLCPVGSRKRLKKREQNSRHFLSSHEKLMKSVCVRERERERESFRIESRENCQCRHLAYVARGLC